MTKSVEEHTGKNAALETKKPEVHGQYRSTGQPHRIQCATTDENQSVEMDLDYCLGHLSVIVGALLFSQGSQSTATLIPCNLHLHSKFSHSGWPVLQ